MNKQNPYISRGPVRNQEMFFGRAKEKERIYEYLASLENVSIVGEPKIGKSSLLINLCRENNYKHILGDNFRLIYINLQDIGEVSLDNFYTLISEVLTKNNIKADFDSAKGFRNFVSEYENGDKKLVFCLDEFEVLTDSDLESSFYSFLRGISVKENFAFIIASRQYLSRICQTKNARDSELWNVFQTFILEGLQEKEAEQLIEIPFQKSNKNLPFKSEEIFKLTGYNPYHIVLACYHIFSGIKDLGKLKEAYNKELDPQTTPALKPQQSDSFKKAVSIIWVAYGISVLFIITIIGIYFLRN